MTSGYERTSIDTSKTFSFGTCTTTHTGSGTSTIMRIVVPAGCTVYSSSGTTVSDGSTAIVVGNYIGDPGAVLIVAP